MKGEEDDVNHHYVQSAKLDFRIYQILENLPESDQDPSFKKLIPNKKEGRYMEDFDFSEEQVLLKDENWKNIQEGLKSYLSIYIWINRDGNVGSSKLLDMVNYLNQYGNYREINSILENLDVDKRELTIRDLVINNNDNVDILHAFEITLFDFMREKLFQNKVTENLMKKSNFIPDFNKVFRSYSKGRGEETILIEEFLNESPSKDKLVWAMAKDARGGVYIDNIYDPEVGVDSYGVFEKKFNAGLLVYKPEDYKNQTAFIPDDYKKLPKNNDSYCDISLMWEMFLPIREYKESLRRRGKI